MQSFELTVHVTINSNETVSCAEVYSAISELLEEFDSGTATISETKEM